MLNGIFRKLRAKPSPPPREEDAPPPAEPAAQATPSAQDAPPRRRSRRGSRRRGASDRAGATPQAATRAPQADAPRRNGRANGASEDEARFPPRIEYGAGLSRERRERGRESPKRPARTEERTERPAAADPQGPQPRADRPAAVDPQGPQPRTERFGEAMVSPPVARALADMGYESPTPIQSLVLEPLLAGEDVVGQAQTGTGKTAGFGIPIAETTDARGRYVQAIVLTPTRELARQVAGEVERLVKHTGARVAAVYGGAPMPPQVRALQEGAQVVVGTPGRVIDHLERGTLDVGRVRLAVLDEADQMLDIGFFPDIRRILRRTPRSRQTALFTATVPTPIKRLIYAYLNNPRTCLAGEESRPVEEVEQVYYEVAGRDKPEALVEVMEERPGEQTLVFCRTQEAVDRVVRIMRRKGHAIEGIHGGMRQRERNAVMEGFREGRVKLLVSTNLTARGIDVPTVENVVNYDIPETVEEYVHRIGRTARMGRPGTAITFFSEWDSEFFEAIRDHVGAELLTERELSLYRPAAR